MILDYFGIYFIVEDFLLYITNYQKGRLYNEIKKCKRF